ncbi:MAG TPA: nitroreductase family protein, partial [Bacteroidales bacterium]|nr:nitroreductase family protein [Bacteroidales bacterium]
KLMSREDKDFYSATDVGYISQNVYLYCASQGLSTVVVGIINRESIAKVLNLDPTQKVLLSQCVGYPEK